MLGLLVLSAWWLAKPVADADSAGDGGRGRVAGEHLSTLSADGAGTSNVVSVHNVAALAPAEPDAPVDAPADAPAGTPARPGVAATFRGRVTDATGKALRDAAVSCLPNITTLRAWDVPPFGGWRTGFDAILAVMPETTTGDDGRFELASTHVDREAAYDPDHGEDAVRPWPELIVSHSGHAMRVHVCSGFHGGDYDAGTITMDPGAAILGRVVDEDGVPLSGVFVEAAWNQWSKRLSTGEPRPTNDLPMFLHTTSAADGRFTLGGLSQDGGSVRFETPGKLKRRIEQAVLAEGEQRDLGDVVLQAGARVAGRVLDDHGLAVHEATVFVSTMIHPAYDQEGDAILADLEELRRDSSPTISDPGGGFAVDGLTADRFVVFAEKTGFEPARSAMVPAGCLTADVVLLPAACVVITVEDADSGQPLGAATAQALRLRTPEQPRVGQELPILAGEDALAALPSDQSAASGLGLFVVRPAGRLATLVRLAAPGHATHAEIVEGLSPGRSRRLAVRLPRDLSATGRVVDARGAPVADASVELRPVQAAALAPEVVVRTDGTGQFIARGLRAGRWSVKASASGYMASPPLEVALDPDRPASLPDLVLGIMGGLSVLVVDARGGPLSGEHVSIVSAGPQFFRLYSVTDTMGMLTVARLPPGLCYLAANAVNAEADVDVIAGQTVQAVLTERRPARIHGRVMAAGVPVPDATVRWAVISDSSTPGSAFTTDVAVSTDEAGLWKATARAGDIRVMAETKLGGISAPLDRRLEWDTDTTIDLVIGTVRLDCLVVDESSAQPLAGIDVTLTRFEGGLAGLRRPTGSDGTCRFDGLVPGRYFARLSLGGEADKGFSLDIDPEPSHVERRLTYSQSAALHGSLTAADSSLVPDGTLVVAVSPALDSVYWLVTSTESRYEMAGLPAGTYTISVRVPEWQHYGDDADPPLADAQVTLKPGETRTLDFTLDYGP